MRNRRAVIARRGGPEALAIVEEDLPRPGPGEIQVRVLASGVAYGDVLKRRGLVPGQPRMPFTPGYDLVGDVEEVGPGVGAFRPGDRVAALVGNGANAERVRFPAARAVAAPLDVDPAQALCLVLNYVTAWQMLHRVAEVPRHGRILVHGAAGGVGTALLDLARLASVQAVGTASGAKHAVVDGFGGVPIDYRREDFVARVRALAPEGVEAAFDPIGGRHLVRSRRTLRRGGRLVAYGISSALAQGRAELALTFLLLAAWRILPGGRPVTFYGVGATAGSTPENVREDLGRLLGLLAGGHLHPLVGARLQLDEVARAHAMVERAEVTGKVVLVVR